MWVWSPSQEKWKFPGQVEVKAPRERVKHDFSSHTKKHSRERFTTIEKETVKLWTWVREACSAPGSEHRPEELDWHGWTAPTDTGSVTGAHQWELDEGLFGKQQVSLRIAYSLSSSTGRRGMGQLEMDQFEKRVKIWCCGQNKECFNHSAGTKALSHLLIHFLRHICIGHSSFLTPNSFSKGSWD